MEEYNIGKQAALTDKNHAFHYAELTTNGVLSFYTSLLGSMILLAVAIAAVLTKNDSNSGALAALSLSYVLDVCPLFFINQNYFDLFPYAWRKGRWSTPQQTSTKYRKNETTGVN